MDAETIQCNHWANRVFAACTRSGMCRVGQKCSATPADAHWPRGRDRLTPVLLTISKRPLRVRWWTIPRPTRFQRHVEVSTTQSSTNARFGNTTTDRRGLAGTVLFDTGPRAARGASGAQHVARWERMRSKRLMPGRLVALVWRAPASTSPRLGPFASALASPSRLPFKSDSLTTA